MYVVMTPGLHASQKGHSGSSIIHQSSPATSCVATPVLSAAFNVHLNAVTTPVQWELWLILCPRHTTLLSSCQCSYVNCRTITLHQSQATGMTGYDANVFIGTVLSYRM